MTDDWDKINKVRKNCILMNFNNEVIRDYILHNSDNKVIKEFKNNCQKMIEALNSIPDFFKNEKMETLEWANLSVEDPKRANNILKEEAEKDIQFLLIVTSFKLYHLFNSIINDLEENKDYEALCLLRVLLENVCFLKYNLEKVKKIVKKINSNTTTYFVYHKHCEDLEKISKKIKKGTKIENVAKEGEGATFAKNILEAVDFVSSLKGYETIGAKYDILSDYTHPNYLSNDFFGVPTEIHGEKEDLFLEKERIILVKGETSLFLKTFPDEFKKLKIKYIGMIISVIDMCISLYLSSKEDFEKIKICNLRSEIPNREYLLSFSKEKRLKMFKEAQAHFS